MECLLILLVKRGLLMILIHKSLFLKKGVDARRAAGGFTLVELVISIVVLSIGVMGILLAISMMIRNSADPVVQYQTVAIAESYIEEIMGKSYPGSTPCPGTPFSPRANTVSICDYNNLNQVPTDQNGNSLGLNNYNVSVVIDTTAAVLGSLTSGSQVLRIDVLVTPPTGPGILFSAYRTNHQ